MLLDADAEWVTAGGFHALCRAHGVASLVEQRRTDARRPSRLVAHPHPRHRGRPGPLDGVLDARRLVGREVFLFRDLIIVVVCLGRPPP